mmetsp:Transcript_9101/g.19438  ORF Transcript_9101/g.19438 Transcript_9101/m.19438 type:complete len:324 (-) Transcript_9101:337-1308(-)|eukprot:CAMPEP_0171338858 /NCGR_PEP_ID=MMETSP0878-20121228/7585_1 /TAXON_ID=67004 /ORGANISM="Thalassiosira weissflogii, Strain CCMP1336" /LENGTH=323 /DNA_ID=CAMNT_0011840685 /DNA_START=19 /DNA_END=990 /DNA_ORIENTATION=-
MTEESETAQFGVESADLQRPPSPTTDPMSRYYKRSRRRRKSFSIPTSEDEFFHVHERHAPEVALHQLQNNIDVAPWQIRLLSFINSPRVQHFLIGLLILDVCILFIELAVDAFYPNCKIILRDSISCCPTQIEDEMDYSSGRGHVSRSIMKWFMRILEGEDSGHHGVCDSPLEPTAYSPGCDDHKYPGVHVAHTVLFSLTMAVLCTFEIELLTMIYLLGPAKFFSHILYVLDLFIVTVSLLMELVFKLVHQDILGDVVGLLIFFRVWRFVRIGHGLVASTFELEEEKFDALVLYVREVEDLLTKNGCDLPTSRPNTIDETNHK